MLVGAVVIANDGASPDVDTATDDGVAQIGQVIGFGFVTNFGRLGFDEIADMHFVGQPCARAHPGIRTDPAVCADHGPFEVGVRRNLRSLAHFHVLQYAPGTDPYLAGQPNPAFEQAVYVDEHVLAALEFAAHINTPRIGHRYTTCHQAAGVLQLMNALKIGQMVFAIHAQNLPVVRWLGRGHVGS